MSSAAADDDRAVPENANEECVGPGEATAGTAPGCRGCPNASVCASGAAAEAPAPVSTAVPASARTILVLSGKGGVGKSTVAAQLASTLAHRGFSVGVLDVDVCGPSAPRMLGVVGRGVHASGSGWSPVYASPRLAVMSVSFLLGDDQRDAAVVWRGPRKNGLIQKFVEEVDWGDDLDYVIVDTPPGTSDEHIETVRLLQQRQRNADRDGVDGAILVTTPEEVSMADVRKELNFCRKTNVKVLGVVENMTDFRIPLDEFTFWETTTPTSTTTTPTDDPDPAAVDVATEVDRTDYALELIRTRCPELSRLKLSTPLFKRSGAGPRGMAEAFGVPYLGKIPLDPNLLDCCERGVCFAEQYENDEDGSPAVRPLNALVDHVVRTLPVEDDEDDEDDEADAR